jgi:hypothetical protein
MVKQIFIDIRHTHLLMHSFLEDSCGTIVFEEERRAGGPQREDERTIISCLSGPTA